MYAEVLFSCILILLFHIGNAIYHGIVIYDILLFVIAPFIMFYRFNAGPYDIYQKNYFSAWRRDVILFSFLLYLLWYNLSKVITNINQYFSILVSLAIPFFISFIGFLAYLFKRHEEPAKATIVNLIKTLLRSAWIIYLTIFILIEFYTNWKTLSFLIIGLLLILAVIQLIAFVKLLLLRKVYEEYTDEGRFTLSKILSLIILFAIIFNATRLNLNILTDVIVDYAGSILLSLFFIDKGYKLTNDYE